MINYEIFRNFANVIEKSMKKVKQILSRIYHIPALKYVVVTLIGIILIGFVDENSVWHHMVNKQRISELQIGEHNVTTKEVEDIVDEAIDHSRRKRIAAYFQILSGKRYDYEDMIILREKDFLGK